MNAVGKTYTQTYNFNSTSSLEWGLTARMLSPDPFVQNASSTQNFNRYSYCMNNPLKYTDPSGYYYYYDFTGRHDSKADYDWRDGLYMDIFESQHSGGSWNSDGSYNLPASDYPAVCNAVNNINHNNRIINENNAKFGEEFNLYSFKMFNRVEYVLSKTKPQISGSKKLGYYLNTTAETIPLNQYFHFNDFFDFGAIDRDWLDKTQIGMESFSLANSSKIELFNLAAKTDASINNLKYVKGVKVVGKVLVVAGVAATGYQTYNDIKNGNFCIRMILFFRT